MIKIKAGTPVKTLRTMTLGDVSYAPGLEGFVVEVDNDYNVVGTFHRILFPSVGVIESMMAGSGFVIDMEALPYDEVPMKATDVNVLDILKDTDGNSFVVDSIVVPVNYTAMELKDVISFEGYRREQNPTGEERTDVIVAPFSTGEVVALRVREV